LLFSKQYNLIVVMKGAPTHIMIDHHKTRRVMALATAGSGDVLTGMITSMLAQGMPVNAAIIGVYLHGLTADTYS
jgi:NAD(P)H-hydrate repair Nnr-like enzyme with NAD(P)H-hydrate dehydratase domain